MNKIIIVYTLFTLFSNSIIVSCPVCVDRISDLQEPFFNKKVEACHA